MFEIEEQRLLCTEWGAKIWKKKVAMDLDAYYKS